MDQSAPSSRRFGSRGGVLEFSDIRGQSYLQEGTNLPCQPGSSERERCDREGRSIDIGRVGQSRHHDEEYRHESDLEEVGHHRDEHRARWIEAT